MRFFQGLLFVVIFYAFCGSLMYYSKQFGIKRGRELAEKEMGLKLKQCNQIITAGK